MLAAMGRTYTTEAVVLRSIRFGEADRVLHLFTLEAGRVNAIAKGVRKTTSRFGGRLEPLTHAELQLHHGRGELETVSGADILTSHAMVRADPARLAVALIGAEAVLKLHVEPEPHPRAFRGLLRFLELLAVSPPPAGHPAHDPLGLAFQLKLLLVAGYLPHLDACAGCGSPGPLGAYSAPAGGAVCSACAGGVECFPLGAPALAAMRALVGEPLARAALPSAVAAEALRVVQATYARHGGFALRALR
jgi:DNA repair protein RecO (recombination protein O)